MTDLKRNVKYLKLAENKYIGWDYDRLMPATFIMSEDKMREAFVQLKMDELSKLWTFFEMSEAEQRINAEKHADMILQFMNLEPNVFLAEVLSINKAGHRKTCLDLEGLIKYYTDPNDED